MKAWIVEKHGGREALIRKDLPDPKPGPGEALVRVEAVGLNHLDVWVRKGVPGHVFPLPLIPGCDVAGRVEALGPLSSAQTRILERDGIRTGVPILVNPTISCGHCESCLNGFAPTCRDFGIIGETQHGGFADFVVVPIQNLILRPASVSAVDAAALPIPFVTAWSMLTRKAQLKAGEWVLIQAGGSGVSVAAIQMAKLLGAVVVTTVGSDEKAKKAKALGADHVIQYKKEPFLETFKKLMKAHGRRGVHVVIDHVGEGTFEYSLRALDWGGRLVTCGATTGSKIQFDLKPLFFKNLSVLGSTMGSQGDLIEVLNLVKEKQLNAVVDEVLPMDRLPEAMEKLEKQQVFGKVVLTQ